VVAESLEGVVSESNAGPTQVVQVHPFRQRPKKKGRGKRIERLDPIRSLAADFRHADHGWACFFRGRGHEQVLSRRYLHHGPWRTVYLPEEDLTMVQFHDLDADVHTAIEQARVGHLIMGYSPIGGIFFHRGDAHPHQQITGNYDRRTKTFFYMMIGDRRISPKLTADLGWLRLHNRDGRGEIGKPVENVRLVYWDEDKAREDLDVAWRSGFEVAALIKGEEVRLDEGYETPFEHPDWVKLLRR
jgi:hypothetical protein